MFYVLWRKGRETSFFYKVLYDAGIQSLESRIQGSGIDEWQRGERGTNRKAQGSTCLQGGLEARRGRWGIGCFGEGMHAIRETDDWVDSSGHALGELADGDVIGVDMESFNVALSGIREDCLPMLGLYPGEVHS